uniref:Uncharacterized protein n=1 Tax=Sander lucioperca TaxID=283035 RepID=A0A8C9YJ65_SANLU
CVCVQAHQRPPVVAKPLHFIVFKLVPNYQSRGLERVIQPTGDDAPTSTDMMRQFPLCLERLSSSIAEKDKTKLTLPYSSWIQSITTITISSA